MIRTWQYQRMSDFKLHAGLFATAAQILVSKWVLAQFARRFAALEELLNHRVSRQRFLCARSVARSATLEELRYHQD
jgi:hypothetical protein